MRGRWRRRRRSRRTGRLRVSDGILSWEELLIAYVEPVGHCVALESKFIAINEVGGLLLRLRGS